MANSWMACLPMRIRSRLEHRPYAKQILSNSAWLFADRAVRMGIGLFVGVWMARFLGPNQFGELSYAIAFVALFSAIGTLGFDGIIVRELVRYPERKNEILGSAFALRLAGGGLACFLAIATIWVLHPAETRVGWLVGLIAVGMVFQAFDVSDLWFQSQVQSRLTVIAKGSAFFISAAVRVGLILNEADVMAFALAITVETALGAVGLFLAFRFGGNAWGALKPAAARMASLLKECWPLLLSGMAIMLYMRIDQVMLAELVGEQEVGLYSAAIRLSEVWYAIPMVIVSSVMPGLTEARSHSVELYHHRLQELFTNLARVAYLLAFPMTILASPLIYCLYGEAYGAAAPILAVHIWAAVFVFLGVARGIYSVNEGLIKIVMAGTMCGAVLNILLNLLLIPRYGALGAAIATTLAYGFSDIAFYRFVPSYKHVYAMMVSAATLGLVKRPQAA